MACPYLSKPIGYEPRTLRTGPRYACRSGWLHCSSWDLQFKPAKRARSCSPWRRAMGTRAARKSISPGQGRRRGFLTAKMYRGAKPASDTTGCGPMRGSSISVALRRIVPTTCANLLLHQNHGHEDQPSKHHGRFQRRSLEPLAAPLVPTEQRFGVRAACCRFPSRKLACENLTNLSRSRPNESQPASWLEVKAAASCTHSKASLLVPRLHDGTRFAGWHTLWRITTALTCSSRQRSSHCCICWEASP
jgi:hypothetical protein